MSSATRYSRKLFWNNYRPTIWPECEGTANNTDVANAILGDDAAYIYKYSFDECNTINFTAWVINGSSNTYNTTHFSSDMIYDANDILSRSVPD